MRNFRSSASHSTILFLIAVFKLVKGLLLLAAAIGVLGLLHRDTTAVLERVVLTLRLHPGNRYVHRVIEKVGVMDARTLREIGAGTFFYAGIFLTEGIGLLYRKRWAEYFTLIVTGSFLPLEVYNLVRHFRPAKLLVVGLNAAVVAYLARSVLPPAARRLRRAGAR